jgi:hypothetical protein
MWGDSVSQKELITKLQAARRQLVVATQLYFRDSDAVAIHTLVAASYNIIRDLSKHRGAPDMAVKDFFLTTISPSKQKQVANWLNSFENFFKHADHDPNGEIELNSEITELMLIDAWAQYEKLSGDLPEAGKVFKIWTGRSKGNTPEQVKWLASLFKGLSKQQLYEVFREAMRFNI